MFWPVQPKALKTCSSAILPPGLMSGLVKVSACAVLAASSAPHKRTLEKIMRMVNSLP